MQSLPLVFNTLSTLLLYWILWYFFHVVNILLIPSRLQLCTFYNAMMFFSHLATVSILQLLSIWSCRRATFFPSISDLVQFFCLCALRLKLWNQLGLKSGEQRAMQSRAVFQISCKLLWNDEDEEKRCKWFIENAPAVHRSWWESSN